LRGKYRHARIAASVEATTPAPLDVEKTNNERLDINGALKRLQRSSASPPASSSAKS